MKLQGKINLENSDVQVTLYDHEALMNFTVTRNTEGDNNSLTFTTDNPSVQFNSDMIPTSYLANDANAKMIVGALNVSSFAVTFQTLGNSPITNCNWTNFEIDFELV